MKHRSYPAVNFHPAILTCLLLLSNSTLSGQYYFYNDGYLSGDIIVEVGCTAGAMNSLTDLGGRKGRGRGFIKDLNLAATKPSYGLYAVAAYRNVVALKAEFTKGSLASSDALLKNKDPDLRGRYGRNLSFRTTITDLQLAAELHPLFFMEYDAEEVPILSPYLIAGIGYYSFSPMAQLNEKWYALHPLRLEGQGFNEYPGRGSYKLKQLNLPMGAGFKFDCKQLLTIRLEITYRMLFTDYLDDVSDSYIDPLLFDKYLSPPQSAIAKQLYSRYAELQPGYYTEAGTPRGDKKDNDAFIGVQVKVGVAIRSKQR